MRFASKSICFFFVIVFFIRISLTFDSFFFLALMNLIQIHNGVNATAAATVDREYSE